MSGFKLSDVLHSGLPDIHEGNSDFNLLGLARDSFSPRSFTNFEPPSLSFGNPFEKLGLPGMGDGRFSILDRIDLPSPRDIFTFSFNRGDMASGFFGDTFNVFSKLQSGPDSLLKFGLHGGVDEVGGILGRLNPANLLGGGEGGLSGLLGGLGTGLPMMKGILGALKGDFKGALGNGVAMGLSLLPGVGPFIGIASAFGLDKVLGGVAKGIGSAIGGIGKKIGGFFKGLFS